MKDEEDFSAYAGARWPALVRSAVLLGSSLAEAEDLAQATLVRCFLAWSKVRRARDRDAYVYRILVNCYRDSRRRRWWAEKPTAQVPDHRQPDPTEEIDTADAVARALARLSAPNREAVVLRYYVHLGEQQIAEVLRIAPGTVKSRLARALAQLSTDADLADLNGGSHP